MDTTLKRDHLIEAPKIMFYQQGGTVFFTHRIS